MQLLAYPSGWLGHLGSAEPVLGELRIGEEGVSFRVLGQPEVTIAKADVAWVMLELNALVIQPRGGDRVRYCISPGATFRATPHGRVAGVSDRPLLDAPRAVESLAGLGYRVRKPPALFDLEIATGRPWLFPAALLGVVTPFLLLVLVPIAMVGNLLGSGAADRPRSYLELGVEVALVAGSVGYLVFVGRSTGPRFTLLRRYGGLALAALALGAILLTTR